MSFYSSPETVYAALWALISGSPNFSFASRRWQHWAQITPDQMPCIFQVQVPQRTIQYDYNQKPVPAVRYFAEWVIYCRTEDTLTGVPAITINGLVAIATAALEPINLGMQGPVRRPLYDTSGNEVAYNAKVNEINIVEGLAGDNALSLAYIPIEIVRPV